MHTFLTHDTISQRADLVRLTREMDGVLRGGAHRAMVVPPREVIVRAEPEAAFLSMPALSDRHGIYINKVGTVFARPAGSTRPMVHALVAVFSSETGEPIAILDGAALTTVKCAAVSALVTDYCAPADARVLAVVGAGVQARQQVRAVCSVRPIREIRLCARNEGARRAFADEVRATAGAGVEVVECASVERAIDGADVVGTATASATPLASFANLGASTHVNCMGGHTVDAREIPRDVLARALLVVEDVPTAIAEAGPVHAAAIELGDLPARDRRELQQRATVFSSTGHAFLDLIATAHVLRQVGLLGPAHDE